jgi:hypothetical protein
MHDSDDKLGVSSGVAVAKNPVDLITRQFEAASTHRLRFRHWFFPPSDTPPPIPLAAVAQASGRAQPAGRLIWRP